MRCCVSPTISTAAEPAAGPAPSPRDVTNAILFREILKPLTAALGPVGEVALGTVVDELFVRRAR
jgi:hypothetical protein